MTPGGFPVVLGGYERAAVDEFLARVDGTLGRGPLLGPPVDAAQLRDVRFGTALRGYRRADVDRALDEARAALDGRPGTTPRDPPPPDAVGGVGPDVAGIADEAMAHHVREVAFSTTRIQPGYDEEEVDAFLDRLEGALLGRAPWLMPEDIRAMKFTTTRLRPGYDEKEVDAFLEEMARQVARQRD